MMIINDQGDRKQVSKTDVHLDKIRFILDFKIYR